MSPETNQRWRALWALPLALLMTGRVAAVEPSPSATPRLDLRLAGAAPPRLAAAPVRVEANRWERAVQASARLSAWDRGVELSAQALRECQAGPYPGATLGVLGTPQSQTEAQPDHCRRF